MSDSPLSRGFLGVSSEGSLKRISSFFSTNEKDEVGAEYDDEQFDKNILKSPPKSHERKAFIINFLNEIITCENFRKQLLENMFFRHASEMEFLAEDLDRFVDEKEKTQSDFKASILDTPPSPKYLQSYSQIVFTFHSLTFGIFKEKFGFIRIQDRLVKFDGSYFVTMVRPISRLSTFGPRELAFNMMMCRFKFAGLIIAFFGFAAVILLLGRSAFEAESWIYYCIDWLLICFSIILDALLNGNDWMISVVALTGIFSVISFFWLMLTLTEKAPSCAALNLKDTSLPSVLRILLKPKAPIVMVSYTWRSKYSIDFARSLAYSLPDVWIDIQRLVGGANVPIETFGVAKDSYALIIVLSNDYLRSEACFTELIAALLYREDQSQVTIIYAPDVDIVNDCDLRIVKKAIELLSSVLPPSHIIRNGHKLLKFLGKHVYRCAEPHFSEDRCLTVTNLAETFNERKRFVSDTSRLMRFYSKYSEPETSLRRELRLPSIKVRKAQPMYLKHSAPISLEKGSIRLGQIYISPDGSAIRNCNGLSDEHVLFFFCLVTVAFMMSILNFRCFNRDEDFITCSTYLYVGYNLVVVACCLFSLSVIISIHIDLDPRNYHDPILLPLNAAAFVSNGLKHNIGESHSHQSGDHIEIVFINENLSQKCFEQAGLGSPLHHSSDTGEQELERLTYIANVAVSPKITSTTESPIDDVTEKLLMLENYDSNLNKSISTMSSFLDDYIGLQSRVINITVPDEKKDDNNMFASECKKLGAGIARSVLVVIIKTKDAALEFLDFSIHLDSTSFIIVTFYELLYNTSVRREGRKLGDFCVILLGKKNGVNNANPYDGLAQAILDNVGCKIGSRLSR